MGHRILQPLKTGDAGERRHIERRQMSSILPAIEFVEGQADDTLLRGASRVDQVQDNMKAIEFIDKFTPEIMEQIDEIFGIEKDEDDD